MKEKDILRFQGPYGSFFLREESAKPVILLAGGTGFAPIKALVEHALHSRVARPMDLVLGCAQPRRTLPAGPAGRLGRGT
jgi:CDP-4-dehydro-6-deoxyglucose reductase